MGSAVWVVRGSRPGIGRLQHKLTRAETVTMVK